MEMLWPSVVFTLTFCVAAVILTLTCVRCRFILLPGMKKEKEAIISDEESAASECPQDDHQAQSAVEEDEPDDSTESEVKLGTEDDLRVEDETVKDPTPAAPEPSVDVPDERETMVSVRMDHEMEHVVSPIMDHEMEHVVSPIMDHEMEHVVSPIMDHEMEHVVSPILDREKEPVVSPILDREKESVVSLGMGGERESVVSFSNDHQRESVLSLDMDPAPPMCGAVDFYRQSYGYINPNSKLRLSALAKPDVMSERDSRRSEMFFDAESTLSGLGTLASWRREIEMMSAFDWDSASQGPRQNVLSKSYDASSEDSYTTAIESSNEDESEKRTMNKKVPKKRLISRKSRSLQRIPSIQRDNKGYSYICDNKASGDNGDTFSLLKVCTSEVVDSEHDDKDDDDGKQRQSSAGDILRVHDIYPKPKQKLNRRGVYGGSLKDKARQVSLQNKVETLPIQKMGIYTRLPKDDTSVARPESVSDTDLCPPPRTRSYPNIFLRSTSHPQGKSCSEKPVDLPSLTVWCPPSSTGVQFTMNVNRKPARRKNPKPCSAPPTAEYVNFKGSIKR